MQYFKDGNFIHVYKAREKFELGLKEKYARLTVSKLALYLYDSKPSCNLNNQ